MFQSCLGTRSRRSLRHVCVRAHSHASLLQVLRDRAAVEIAQIKEEVLPLTDLATDVVLESRGCNSNGGSDCTFLEGGLCKGFPCSNEFSKSWYCPVTLITQPSAICFDFRHFLKASTCYQLPGHLSRLSLLGLHKRPLEVLKNSCKRVHTRRRGFVIGGSS